MGESGDSEAFTADRKHSGGELISTEIRDSVAFVFQCQKGFLG
jgi:hypothetical protein